jgi:TrmH family RNA methyltransferase
MRKEITGFSNPLVKRIRSLRDKKHRRREGLFLAEGLRILTEADALLIRPQDDGPRRAGERVDFIPL